MGGHLDVLKYAHDNGCPWSEITCAYAANGGHLNVLKYAREKGCPWNKEQCLECAHVRGKEVKAWIRRQKK